MIEHLKEFFKSNQKDLVLLIGIIFVSLSSFALGRLTAPRPEKTPIRFTEYDVAKIFGGGTNGVGESSAKTLVASKNGKYYHFPWCPGATNIKETNKVWFSTVAEAKTAGYQAAPNCLGLEE